MIDDLDEVLRRLLIREIPIKNGEVEIKFDQPKREWSARLSRPTLNIFLYDVRENLKLRGSENWQISRHKDGTVSQKRNPVRVDLHYMITAWANDPDDEHRLLARVLMALFRQPHLPKDLLTPSLQNQPVPITLQIAQEADLDKPTDVWNTIDNELKPAVALTITLVLDPYEPIVAPIVRTRELRFGQAEAPRLIQELVEKAGRTVYWAVGGELHTQKSYESLTLTLVERGDKIHLDENGRFTVGRLRAGDYTLAISSNGEVLKTFSITVPSPEYELEL
ncbi:MAG: DUF4255 domain-containing protein [Anaerolineales bacterium]|nr:DUF4255 domain-containing protein [Anaerolineales bacterium]